MAVITLDSASNDPVQRAVTPLDVGGVVLPNRLVVSPMAGVTDRPFRQLCRQLGAGMAVSEMLTSDKRLWHTRKSQLRMDHRGEPGPIVVQIAGAEPDMLAEAAQLNVQHGAAIIDINMGCPAKKVCNKLAGSALLADPPLVREILQAVVAAVGVPVTLKIRTGPTREHNNALDIARMAEDCGIAALAVHGRARSDAYRGEAEYDTIAAVKQTVSIPVFANGDVDSPQKAAEVLRHTQADGLYIGRAAQGSPWLFREIAHYLQTGNTLPEPSLAEQFDILSGHLRKLHQFYGEHQGVRIARKHIGWYLKAHPGGEALRKELVRLEDPQAQIDQLAAFFGVAEAPAAASA
jgi:tRNA-dihydrouridine synthase B